MLHATFQSPARRRRALMGERVPAPTWQATHWRRPALRVGGAALISGHIVHHPVELPVRASPFGDNDESTYPEDGDLAARGETPAAFDRRSIPAGRVAPRSHIARYARSSRLASRAPRRSRCFAGFHHGLLAGAGAITAVLGRYLPEHLLRTRDSDVVSAWDGPAATPGGPYQNRGGAVHYRSR